LIPIADCKRPERAEVSATNESLRLAENFVRSRIILGARIILDLATGPLRRFARPTYLNIIGMTLKNFPGNIDFFHCFLWYRFVAFTRGNGVFVKVQDHP